MGNSPHITSIHVLDDDSLLNIFYLYRPFFLGEYEDRSAGLNGGTVKWDQERWWYRLTHVCQRWRSLTLSSASYLRLSLVCTNGTPVENMLAHSPPLPLTVDYRGKSITVEDEEGILLALEQRHRVRHLRLALPIQNLQKLVKAIDEEFPILEYLVVDPWPKDSTALVLPETLQTPHLRHLWLSRFTFPVRPRLHPTAAGLVTLFLVIEHRSTCFQPNVLRQWISFMPQLERLVIVFSFPVSGHDVERQLTHTPITTHITLPNLRLFLFKGASAYLEAFIYQITAPRLKRLHIQFFKEPTFSISRLVQFMNTTEKPRFGNAMIVFKDNHIDVLMSSRREANRYIFNVTVYCSHFDQVSFVAQICNALSQVLSTVEHLLLQRKVDGQLSEEHNDVDRIEWRNLLRSFSNAKTLHVEDGLVEELSRCLRLEDGEPPLELLPELQKLTYLDSGDLGDAFASFIDARQNAGRPVSLVSRSPRSSFSNLSSKAPAITSASGDTGNDIET